MLFRSERDRGYEVLAYRGLDAKHSSRKGKWIAYKTVIPYAVRRWKEKKKYLEKIIEMRTIPFHNKKIDFHMHSFTLSDVILVSIYGIIMILVILVEVIL